MRGTPHHRSVGTILAVSLVTTGCAQLPDHDGRLRLCGTKPGFGMASRSSSPSYVQADGRRTAEPPLVPEYRTAQASPEPKGVASRLRSWFGRKPSSSPHPTAGTSYGDPVAASSYAALRPRPVQTQAPRLSFEPLVAGAGVDALMDRQSRLAELAAQAGDRPEAVGYYQQRADVLAQITGVCKPEEREFWIRQMADCLQYAVAISPRNDRIALTRLTALEQQAAASMPGSNLAAYIAYRAIQAECATGLAAESSTEEISRRQEQWRGRLEQFVNAYPLSEEAKPALMDLALVCEYMNRDEEARLWYRHVASQYPGQPIARKAEGAMRRLDLDGKELRLALPLVFTRHPRHDIPFDIDQLRGKPVVVYFWSSKDMSCLHDFEELRALRERHANKGLELLCVNLDDEPQQARMILGEVKAPGVHVFQRGGLEGIVATRFGVLVVPTMMLVGPDGRVVQHDAELGTLDKTMSRKF